MRPSMAKKAIRKAIKIQRPIFVWGSMGIGKSEVIKQIADEEDMQLIDLRLSQLDAPDMRGFPHISFGKMCFAMPDFFPDDAKSRGVLFLDELNAAMPAVQAAAYQLILDRKVGKYQLPDGWAVVAAGNRESDQGVVYTMAAPLSNRFIHIDFDANFEDWRAHALKANFRTETINFMNFRPGLLNAPDPDKRAFPTPRSWKFVSDILDSDEDKEVERALINGAVGEGAASEFAAFLKIYRDLPNPDAVLMNPTKADVPKDNATLYALCGALSERASEANFDRLIQYCSRLKEVFQVLCIRDSVARHPPLADTAEFSKWAIENASVLV